MFDLTDNDTEMVESLSTTTLLFAQLSAVELAWAACPEPDWIAIGTPVWVVSWRDERQRTINNMLFTPATVVDTEDHWITVQYADGFTIKLGQGRVKIRSNTLKGPW